MTKQVFVDWQQQRFFVGNSPHGGDVAIDGDHVGRGMGPSELLLAALGGCVSTTVIGVLEKKRQQITGYAVEITGEQMPDWPKAYTQIHISYRVKGVNIDPAAVERAVELAETRYCTVSASLRAPITHSIEVSNDATAA
jgi:putative redox protein